PTGPCAASGPSPSTAVGGVTCCCRWPCWAGSPWCSPSSPSCASRSRTPRCPGPEPLSRPLCEDRVVPVGRFAPSPTGPLHVGNLRTALVAWLAARSSSSGFLLRSEDLDPGARRSHEAGQLADLRAIGVDWDGPVTRQSERRDLYEDALARL